ncbi:MAG: hypothetical protein H6732_17960 [Alphaproteobacteria bacterium]|nr:hypothetical protein [Alphaproteobacteria bacterium]
MLLLLLATALAEPVPVSLPGGGGPAWHTALEQAELVLVPPTQARVRIEEDGGAWQILVVGTDRTARLPVPRTATDRATVAWMAASLAEALPLGRVARGTPPPPATAASDGPRQRVRTWDGSTPTDVEVPVAPP